MILTHKESPYLPEQNRWHCKLNAALLLNVLWSVDRDAVLYELWSIIETAGVSIATSLISMV